MTKVKTMEQKERRETDVKVHTVDLPPSPPLEELEDEPPYVLCPGVAPLENDK